MSVRSFFFYFVCFFLAFSYLLLSSSHTYAANTQSSNLSPQEILRKFSQSSKNTSYKGNFTYDDGRNVSAYHVVHGILNGKERQKLKSLHGPELDFLIDGGDVNCSTIAGRLIQGNSVFSEHYNIVLKGQTRIANRNAWNIMLVPKDIHRYGIALSIDSESYVLLRYLIYNDSQKILERLQFISLNTDVSLAASDFDLPSTGTFRRETNTRCMSSASEVQSVSTWGPSWLPSGFVLSLSSSSREDGFMDTYTDGLSVFSIFVSKAKPLTQRNEKRVEQGVYKKGASLAVFNLVPVNGQPLQVTVVGDIPLDTAQKIALSMSSAGS